MAVPTVVRWTVDRLVRFAPDDFVKDGCVHFGFHARNGRFYGIDHPHHFMGSISRQGTVEWTAAPHPVFPGIANIAADLQYPMYVDVLADGRLIVSNFGNARLICIDPVAMKADVLVDGRSLGMSDMGNCVVDHEGSIWINEVTGCRLWRFDPDGHVIEKLGSGAPGFEREAVPFADARFSWIYDIRRGPGTDIYVLDSKNFAVRVLDLEERVVRTLAGTGQPGYTGDGGAATMATFGSDPTAKFDGPFSMSIDEAGNVYVGDHYNRAVRMIERATGLITTIAGGPEVNLPQITSMDYWQGRLFVPTDIDETSRELVVLSRQP